MQAIGYLASVHMRGEGIWQDPRVPFVQIALMTKLSNTWTRAELLDTLAERGEFPLGFIGADNGLALTLGDLPPNWPSRRRRCSERSSARTGSIRGATPKGPRGCVVAC